MLRLSLVLALALTLPAVGCDSQGTDARSSDPVPIELSPVGEALVQNSNAFGVGLFARTVAEDDGNLMLSPLSASVALTMLLNGTDGDTYTQIRDMLGYAEIQDLDAINAAYQSLRTQLLAADPEVQFTLANAVFYDSVYNSGAPFKAPFLTALQTSFDATSEGLPFGDPAALDVINGWASENTNGRVPRVLDEISQDLVLILMNALYFKGSWTTEFEASDTQDADFRRADGSTVRVPTMTGKIPSRLAHGDGYTAIEMPYGRQNFSFVALLPDEGSLSDFAARLDAGLWTDAVTRLGALPDGSGVTVRLPRFSFSTDQMLNKQLQALGMTDAFSRAADLSRMSDDPRLQVSFVKQNTFVDVNEEGTEAAAVTTVGVEATSAGPAFVADRPFVFAIRERTSGTLLFIGQVADPS